MANTDNEILSCARKIHNYCNGRLCDNCVFNRYIGEYNYCALSDDEGSPSDWVIPKSKKVVNDGRE